MNDKIVHLIPKEVGESFRLDVETVFDKVKGQSIDRLLVLVSLEDGSYQFEGNCNTGEALFLLERAKMALMEED